MTTSDADAILTINNSSINFNNNARQLRKASVASGLKNMSWHELSGLTVSTSSIQHSDNVAESRSGLSGVGSYGPIGAAETENLKRTPGFQLLVLSFAEIIQLTEDYYAPGSLGSFSLQVAIKVQNHQTEDWAVGGWELLLIPMNSGISGQ